MAVKKRTSHKRSKQAATYDDFRTILQLPERLAKYLRELLHVDKAEWDFCLDKVRQYKTWQEQKKQDPGTKALPPERRLYTEQSRSKGRGKGRRYLAAPCEELKTIQKAILHRFLDQCRVHFCRHGQKNTSIITNARRHANFAIGVYTVDIVNAFPTVFRSRVFANLAKPFVHAIREFSDESIRAVRKDKKLVFTDGNTFSGDDVAMMLNAVCDLVCLRDRLPQGTPTSPRILSIVCRKMDTELYGLLEQNSTPFQSYRITAYVDDITISSDGPIPEELREKVLEIIQKNGFIPHTRKDKTKYFSPETGEVPIVTGLVINTDGRITMAPKKVSQLRARLDQLLRRKTWDSEQLGQVNGILGYILQIYRRDRIPSKLRGLVGTCEERKRKIQRDALAEKDEAPEKKPRTKAAKTASKPSGSTRLAKPKSPPAVKECAAPFTGNGNGHLSKDRVFTVPTN